jgi:acyl carrier protein
MSATDRRHVTEVVYEQLARFSGRRSGEISPDLSLADDLGIQSVTAVELLGAVEQQLGVEIDIADDGDTQTVHTVQDLVDEVLRSAQDSGG